MLDKLFLCIDDKEKIINSDSDIELNIVKETNIFGYVNYIKRIENFFKYIHKPKLIARKPVMNNKKTVFKILNHHVGKYTLYLSKYENDNINVERLYFDFLITHSCYKYK